VRGAPMNHDILGRIERSESNAIDGVATIRYGSRDIKVRIIRDDQAFETTVELAAQVVQGLEGLDKLAKQIAAAGLRETYNSGWNEYDEVQADGTLKTVSNPRLTEAEFEKRLSLNTVNVTGDRVIDFYYDDEGMFWAHSVVVCSLNGVDLSN